MVLNFSYYVKNKTLLKNIKIESNEGSVLLISGDINKNLLLLSGILCGLIPSTDKLDIEHLEYLFQDYYGKLEIHQGILEEYYLIGDQPDRHFLFSMVFEEFMGRTTLKKENEIIEKLNQADLDSSFYFRKINTLSGGEKTKLAIALAMSSDSKCFLFYNCVPWLDNTGRKILYNFIKKLISANKKTIIFEQEYDFLLPLVTSFANFENNTLKYEKQHIKISPKLYTLIKKYKNNQSDFSSDECILNFKNVLFNNYPNNLHKIDQATGLTYPLLNNISFTITKKKHFILTGENGSGKSTIFNLCFRLIKPQIGEITLLNKNINDFNRNELCSYITYISQFPQYQLIHHNLSDYKNLIKDDFLQDKLNSIIPNSDNLSVIQMSLFEMKILLLLSSINSRTKLLMLDEPSWGLDNKQIFSLLNLLFDLMKQYDFTIFAITHSKEFIKNINFNTLEINKGILINET